MKSATLAHSPDMLILTTAENTTSVLKVSYYLKLNNSNLQGVSLKTGQAREYGCPIGTVFKIGDADGTGNCEDPEDVPGW